MKPLTPQELSIGNLLNYDTGEGIELSVIDWQDLRWLQQNPESFNNSHTPVPLTPEILEGFGLFNDVDDGYFYFGIKTEIDHLSWDEKQGLVLYDNDGNGTILKHIQHAHTLQNFIHAISGVELVYKQNKTE